VSTHCTPRVPYKPKRRDSKRSRSTPNKKLILPGSQKTLYRDVSLRHQPGKLGRLKLSVM
jgi:hypothetical protein